jgi:peptidoglycan-associated lipoprotein
MLQGAAGSQIEVVSYGEERPVAFGHDEESWSLNRRVEIIYKSR